MQRTTPFKHLPFLTLAGVLVASSIPYFLTLLGVGFSPASKGGAGAHFAGFNIGSYLIRLDVSAFGLLALLAIMGTIYNRLSPNRFVKIMGASLFMGGLALAVQILPQTTATGQKLIFARQAYLSTTIGHLGTSILLLAGILTYRFGHRLVPRRHLSRLWPVGALILLLTWSTMTGGLGSLENAQKPLQLLAMVVYLVTGFLTQPRPNTNHHHFFRLGLLALLIPQVAGLTWMHLSPPTFFHQGYHIATLLWWMALLLPVLGLGIDFNNTYLALSMAEEKKFLRLIIDAIPHFVFSRDVQGRFTLVNRAVADFYGKDVDEIEGKHLADIHADREQREAWLEEDARILAKGAMTTIEETQAKDVDGKPIWIDTIKTPLTGQGVTQPQVLGISIDVSRQKKAEEALAKRLHFEVTGTSVLRQFLRCTTENFDQQMHQILGQVASFAGADRCALYRLETEEARKWHCWLADGKDHLPEIIKTEDLQWTLPTLNQGVSSQIKGDPSTDKMCHRSLGLPDDHTFLLLPIIQLEELAGFLILASAETRNWGHEEIVLFRNIVDLYVTVWSKLEAEKSLNLAREKAEASSLAKSEFLANMSHEIRTPMNCVIGISELLQEMDPNASQKQYLEMISHSGTSLLTLINDILDISKIEAGQLELDPIKTNLREMVEEAVGLIAFNAQAKGLEMVCRYAPGAPDVVVCDPNRLRQVLTNLLNNAYKFTKSGHIYLNVEPVGLADGKLQMCFQVTDTGIGIPQAKLDRIFEKFTQADTSTTRRFGGTGLGLSISQQLVQLMGGRIEVSSEDGHGSTFSFTIPVEEVPGSLQAPAHAAQPDRGILVISHHELGCEVLAEQVRHLGYECSTALGRQQGLKLLERVLEEDQKHWSYILVDQDVLPEETPLIMDLLGRIPELRRPKPILLTSLSCIVRENDLVQSGFTSTLTKPVRPHRLADVLNGVADRDYEPVTSCLADPELPDDAVSQDLYTEKPVVLLAEDNPFNQKVAIGMLRLLGCQVEVAGNGVEALDLVGKNDYRVVFMDCQMPEMDGYEATERIRQLVGKRSRTPIIAMTANALSGDRRACFASGMNDFLSKPITKAKLSEMLAKWDVVKETVNS